MNRRRFVVALVVLAIANFVPPTTAAQECFGRRATIPIGTGVGSPCNDVLIASHGGCAFDGGPGSDRICGKSGIDFLVGGYGNDRITGGAGSDLLTGDLFAAAGAVRGQGNARLSGGDDLDTIV